MKEKAVTLLFISILASSALAANSVILTDKLINGSFEQPQLGEPVANWNYEGPACRKVTCTDFEPQEGNYSGRSLATWYCHDLPDAHLWQQINTSQDIWCNLTITGYVKRYVIEEDITQEDKVGKNRPDWGWVTVELTVDGDIIWSKSFDADDKWHYFQYTTAQPVHIKQSRGVHIRWGTLAYTASKSFDCLVIDGFHLKEDCTTQTAYAFNPNPSDKAAIVDTDVALSWSPGVYATSHDIYLGTNFNDVSNANTSNLEIYKANLSGDVNSFAVNLEPGRTYYWRVDEVNGSNIYKGKVWSFKVVGDYTVATVPPSKPPIGWWKFDGDATDSIGNNDGIIYGDPQWVNGAIELDGDGDYVVIEDESFFDITNQITVTAWIKVNALNRGFQTIVAKGDDSWRLHAAEQGGSIEFACNGTGATAWTGKLDDEIPWAVVGTKNVDDGKWHHIAGVYDGSKLYLYIDGLLDASKKVSDRGIDNSDYPVYIGENAQMPGRFWNGLIDDVRIYDYALSASEIAYLASEGLPQLYISLPEALYEEAKRYEQSGQYDQAKRIYQTILSHYPDTDYALNAKLSIINHQIQSYVNAGEDDKAFTAIDNLITDFNDYPGLPKVIFEISGRYYAKAIQQDRKGNQAKAQEYYLKTIIVDEKIIEQLPVSPQYTPRAYYGAAICYSQELGEYEKAIKYYQKIVENWPDYKYAWHAQYFVGKYYEKWRDAGGISALEANPKIEQAYQAVIENYPDSPSVPWAALKLGRMSFEKEHWDEAVMYFELFLEKEPERLRYVVLDLGYGYEQIQAYDAAIDLYNLFIATANPDDSLVKTVKNRLEKLEGVDK